MARSRKKDQRQLGVIWKREQQAARNILINALDDLMFNDPKAGEYTIKIEQAS